VLIDGAKVATIVFDLTLVFRLDPLAAIVRDGNLVAFRGGDCLATATLTVDGAKLAERERHLDLNRIVPVHPGIPLVGATAELQPQGQETQVLHS